MSQESIASPHLRGLADRLASEPAVLAEFWRRCAVDGTPIFEPAGEDAVLVTFVWQGDPSTRNVVLLEWITEGDFADKQMANLPGTDIWHRSITMRSDVRTSYHFSPNDSLVPKVEETDWPTRQRGWVSDPFNPQRIIDPRFIGKPGLERYDGSVLALQNDPISDWSSTRESVPRGSVEQIAFTSDLLGDTRDVWIYLPPAASTEPLDLAVIFDGERHESVMRLPTVLDNLNASGAVLPLAALMVSNPDRGTELPCNPTFSRAIATELLPDIIRSYPVTDQAERTVVAGQSYGGLAAMFAGFQHPEVFGNVLSQSGSFWWKPNPHNDDVTLLPGDAPAYSWLPTEVAQGERRPFRVWMEVGRLENRSHQDEMPSMTECNRHMRDVLIAKGYDVQYREYGGGHDYVCWRDTTAEGLISLLGKEGQG